MALKILIAGFSGPSASALALLLQRNYPEVQYIILERCFSDDLRLTLPTLGADTNDAFAAIINLDGVGMSLFEDQYIKKLVDFIDFRTSLLLTRGKISLWQNADFLPHNTSFFLGTPYTKADMENALTQLISIARHLQSNPADAAKNRALIHKKALGHLEEEGIDEVLPSLIQNPHNNIKFIRTLTDTCFSGVCPNGVIHELTEIFSQNTPFKLLIGSQAIYVHPKNAIALICDLERLIDYFSVAGNCRVLRTNLINTPMTDGEFNEILANIKQEGYHRYSPNALLWQIYSTILPKRIDVPQNTLKLKIRYMPNFAGTKDMPDYIHAVLSSCLVVPKNLEQLEAIFGELTSKNPSALHRVFLLAILSGVADMDVLKRSFYIENPSNKISSTDKALLDKPEPTPEHTPNKGITQATKTGFFRRLLNKLSF